MHSIVHVSLNLLCLPSTSDAPVLLQEFHNTIGISMFGYVCQARCGCFFSLNTHPSVRPSVHLSIHSYLQIYIHTYIHTYMKKCILPCFLASLLPCFIHPSMNPYSVFQPRPLIRPWFHSSNLLPNDTQASCMVDFGILSDQPRHAPRHKASGNWVAVKVLRKRNVIKYKQVRPQTLHPTPYTLHPTPYTLHPTPYTLHPTP
jgi:hypothetical protein